LFAGQGREVVASAARTRDICVALRPMAGGLLPAPAKLCWRDACGAREAPRKVGAVGEAERERDLGRRRGAIYEELLGEGYARVPRQVVDDIAAWVQSH